MLTAIHCKKMLERFLQNWEVPAGCPEHWTSQGILDNFHHKSVSSVGWQISGEIKSFILYRHFQVIEVDFLATHPGHKRQGYMATLWENWLSSLKSPQEIWLEVSEINEDARKLYKKLGLLVVGSRENYYSDGANALLLSHKI